MRSIHTAAPAALLAGLLSCRSAESVAPRGAWQVSVQGLEQTVRLIPAELTQGEPFHIVSVVTNGMPDSTTVLSRICGLDTAGDLALVTSGMACAGYSMSAQLAPRDSVTGSDVRVVTSPPGQYTLRVRQLLAPEAWVEIPVVVH